jgi:hypothetical protein
MFSLCIPTMDRFDTFLSRYLVKYLANEYINEIIITDENGNDIKKIKTAFPDNTKLVLIKNETRLGPFLNKQKACSFAKNEWIVLMDSDNFAYKEYFKIAKDYIAQLGDQKNIILAPSKAQPNFDYSHLSGFIYKKGSFATNNQMEGQNIKSYNCSSVVLMNTGNYVINKFLLDKLNLHNEYDNIHKSSACDVIYFNTLLFEQLDLHMHVVPDLVYDHVVHDGSIYTQTVQNNQEFNNSVHKRYFNLI